MLLAAEDLERRRPVWEAMSDLFLDTQPDDFTYRNLARRAAESGFSDDDLDRIFREEVAPVVYHNVHDVAGEWMLFRLDWLEANILCKRGWVYWLERTILMRPALSLVWDDWNKAKGLIPAIRAGRAASSERPSAP